MRLFARFSIVEAFALIGIALDALIVVIVFHIVFQIVQSRSSWQLRIVDLLSGQRWTDERRRMKVFVARDRLTCSRRILIVEERLRKRILSVFGEVIFIGIRSAGPNLLRSDKTKKRSLFSFDRAWSLLAWLGRRVVRCRTFLRVIARARGNQRWTRSGLSIRHKLNKEMRLCFRTTTVDYHVFPSIGRENAHLWDVRRGKEENAALVVG